MLITNKYNLPQALVDAVKGDGVREHKGYGVTTILKPVREIILMRRHEGEIEVDVSDCINRLFGTAFHSLIEQHDKTGMAEITLEKEINGLKLIGKLDLYDTINECVIDYKTATVWKVMLKDFEDWRKQGLIYAWLCMQNGYSVKKIKFYAFLKDWTAKDKRAKDDDYPESQVYTYELNVGINELVEIETWLEMKFGSLKNELCYNDDELVPCTKEECWYTGDKYAVYKNVSDKKAQRLFDSKVEAEGYLKEKMDGKGIVVFRQGEYRKCQDYCEVCNFCNIRKERI
jgi:hypothetical protein